MPALRPGSEIAGCRLETIAGRGGMGVVWRATQLALNRPVALKAIAPGLAQDQSFRERFQREALLAASIDHPNVIPVYEAGELDETLYLIMRWVDGTDLRARVMANGRMPPATAIRLLRPVASALAAAHRRGLIHRDVKPANVLITDADDAADEHVYLTDFGIARRNDSRGMTRTGVLIGTIDYIAPEMIQGARGTSASDIYAFGCMLFETLTGHVPFDRPTELAKMHAHISDPVPLGELPSELAQVVGRAMAKQPEDRFASAGELVAALDAVSATDAGPTRAAAPDPGADATVLSARADDPGAPVLEAPSAADRPTAGDQPTRLDPGPPVTPATPAAAPATPAAAPATPAAARATSAAAPVTPAAATRPQPPAGRRRGILPLAIVAIAAVIVIAVIVATSGGGGGGSSGGGGGGGAEVSARVVSGSGLTTGTAKTLAGTPAALAADTGDVWASTHDRLIQLAPGGGTQIVGQQTFAGPATALAVDGRSRLWVAGVGRPDGVHGASGNVIETGQRTNLLALDPSAAWIGARGAASLIRADLGSLASAPQPVSGPLAAFGVGFGRLWAASSDGHVTVLDADGHRDALPAPDVAPGTVGITPSNGVWFVSGSGTLNRMDPRTTLPAVTSSGHYVLHPVPLHIDGGASAVGSWPDTNAIWILSRGARSLVRVATHGSTDGTITARVTFSAEPGHLAVGDHVVWVDFPDAGAVMPITYR